MPSCLARHHICEFCNAILLSQPSYMWIISGHPFFHYILHFVNNLSTLNYSSCASAIWIGDGEIWSENKVFRADNATRWSRYLAVRTPTQCHIDLACNTSYHFAASRMVSHGCRLTMAWDRLRLLAHVYDSVASIHMTENPGHSRLGRTPDVTAWHFSEGTDIGTKRNTCRPAKCPEQ